LPEVSDFEAFMMNEWMKQRDLLIQETMEFVQEVAANSKIVAPWFHLGNMNWELAQYGGGFFLRDTDHKSFGGHNAAIINAGLHYGGRRQNDYEHLIPRFQNHIRTRH
jgi:hypothetical protein